MPGVAETVWRAAEEVEDFRGDVGGLAALMRDAWATGPSPPYLYTGELLADCLRYPGAGPALAPSVYEGDELVAFVLGHPRRTMLGGAERRIVIAAFLTVAADRQASGLGIVAWSALVHRAREMGFDGVLSYCAAGGPMDRMVPAAGALLALPTVEVAAFSYLTAALASSSSGGCAPATIAELMSAASALPNGLALARRWSPEEAAWALGRFGGVSAAAAGSVLTGSVMTIADDRRTRCLVVDDVLWGEVAGAERRRLVHGLLARARDAGAEVAAAPRLGYADLRPFLENGFVPSPHTVRAYLTCLRPLGALDPAPAGIYLDVI